MVLRCPHPKQKFPLWLLHKPHIKSESKDPEPDHVEENNQNGTFYKPCLPSPFDDYASRYFPKRDEELLHGSVYVKTLLLQSPLWCKILTSRNVTVLIAFNVHTITCHGLFRKVNACTQHCFGRDVTLQPTVKTNHLILYKCFGLDIQW